MRAFLALPLPFEWQPILSEFLAKNKKLWPQLRWQPLENMHITLRFFANLEADLFHRLCKKLHFPNTDMKIWSSGEIATFTKNSQVSVVWAGLSQQSIAKLRLLRRTIDHFIGFAAGDRESFTPHLTLARIPKRATVNPSLLHQFLAVNRLQLPHARIDEMILFESTVSHAGARYEVIHRFTLGMGA